VLRSLDESGQVTLATVNGVVRGSVELGPSKQPGGRVWHVAAVLWYSTRIGAAPIPRVQVWKDSIGSGIQCQSYDGSFGSASGSVDLTGSNVLIAEFVGGQAGDVITFACSGTQE